MSGTKKYSLFLNNKYTRKDNIFCHAASRGTIKIAVDGGIRYFLKNKTTPDLMVGDFDSSPKLSRKYLSKIEVVRYSPEKDKTDSHLALDLALKKGAREIRIFGALSIDETDHTLGNIFLLELVNRYCQRNNTRVGACILAPGLEIRLLENNFVRLIGRKNDYVSVIPLSDQVPVKYKGLRYPAPKRPLILGDSLSLRNRFLGKTCEISIKGKAIIVVVRNS